MPKLCVKWGPKKFEVDADTELEPLVLKSQLFELTGVLPERQKVLIKGKQLQDDSWEGITLQDGLTIMMMGSVAAAADAEVASEKAANETEAQSKSQESISSLEKQTEKLILPVGLRNLGNTCYMNACFQAYKTIPELMASLKNYSSVENETNRRSHLLISSAKKFYEELNRLEKSNQTSETDFKFHTPLFLLMTMHNTFPQFAARDGHGHYQQQDANECFSEVLQILANQTDVPVGGQDGFAGIFDSDSKTDATSTPATIKAARIFETEFDVTLKCLESEEEPVEKTHESHMQLSCFLSQEVRYIQSGIKNRLTEEIEKHSATLDKDVKYQKQSLISRLPEYMCVQMVRFFFKKKDQINAKILKDVKFPINLDLYDVCAPQLQEKLKTMRDRYKIYDDKKVEELRRSKLDDFAPSKSTDSAASKNGKNSTEFWSNSFSDDPGSNNSGFYELKAVITHKGRTSNSGHYVAWVRINATQWAMCDDDEVHPIGEEDVLKLSGGGDWHCAYVLVYGPRLLPKYDEPVAADSGAAAVAEDTTKMELD